MSDLFTQRNLERISRSARQRTLEKFNRNGPLLRMHFAQGKVAVSPEIINEYCQACSQDLMSIVDVCQLSTPHSPELDPFRYLLLHQIFDLSASVTTGSLSNRAYAFSLGIFLACDDFSGLVAPYFRGEHDFLNGVIPLHAKRNERNWSSRFSNYDHLRDIELGLDLQEASPLFGPYCFQEYDAVRSFVSNLMLAWFVLHEVGHYELGHCGDFYSSSGKRAFAEENFKAPSRSINARSSDHVALSKAREFEADIFATLSIIFLFLRKETTKFLPNIGIVPRPAATLKLLTKVVSYCAIIMELADSREGKASDLYPSPYARLYNIWACFELAQPLLCDVFSSEWSGGVMEGFSPEDSVDAWCDVFPHISYVTDFLDIDLSIGSALKTQSLKFGGLFTRLGNEHKRIEANKIIQSLWGAHYRLNYFTEHEQPYHFIEEWSNSMSCLETGLSERFRRARPYDGTTSTVNTLMVWVVDMILRNMKERRARLTTDVMTAKKVFVDSVVIAEFVRSNQTFNIVTLNDMGVT